MAQWFRDFAAAHGKFEVDLVDIAAFGLPVFDEPEHPSKRDYKHEATRKWSASVDSADAYVFVIPEYNHFTPPALVNAMNYVYHEWSYKPLGFVGYGGNSGALRAIEATKPFASTFKMVPLVEEVTIPFFEKRIDAEGRFVAEEATAKKAEGMLTELARWAEALKPLRAKQG